jgi:uncharacterized membrane protein
MKTLWVLHAGATLFMTGLIWIVQVVHYPLFERVGQEAFRLYEQEHTRLITFIVGPLMLFELLTGLALLTLEPNKSFATWIPWLLAALLGVIWVSTVFLQIPLHGKLSAGFEAEAHRLLVTSNWIRTIAWSVRAGIVLWVLTKI